MIGIENPMVYFKVKTSKLSRDFQIMKNSHESKLAGNDRAEKIVGQMRYRSL